MFGDTILVYSYPLNNDENIINIGDVNAFFNVIIQLLGTSIVIKLPLRVGIAYGKTYINHHKNIFLGKPLVLANELEKNQNWVGGACHNCCKKAPNTSDGSLLVVSLYAIGRHKIVG